ncbi:hypothetical protein LCGC14_0427680 [marine sediment metagenome]|uniref:Phage head morphogenesis domain-containing protein n=1 Tax=marine sediment metagenome TaxID=412755 RepID=A0A0F9VYJ2_9ZZZZ
MKLLDRVKAAFDGLRGKTLPKHPLIDAFLRGTEDKRRDEKVTQPFRQHPWIKAAVTVVARAFSRPELQVWQGDKRIDVDQPEHPLVKLLNAPNSRMSGQDLREGTAIFMELFGSAIWVLETGSMTPTPSMPITAISLPNPTRMDFELDKITGEVALWVLDKNTPRRRTFQPFEIIQFRYFNPWDDIKGLPAISAVQRAMNLDHQAMRHLTQLMQHGISAGAYLATKQELTETVSKGIQKDWQRKHGGPDKTKNIPVMHSGLEIKGMPQTSREMQLLELVQRTTKEFAAGMMVPPILLGEYDRATYSNAPVQERILWEWNVIPKALSWQSRINRDLAPRFGKGLTVTLDLGGIQALQRTLKEEVEAAIGLFKMNVPLAEIEELFDFGLNLDNIPWAKESFVASANVPIRDLLGLDENGKPLPEEKPEPKPVEEEGKNDDIDGDDGGKAARLTGRTLRLVRRPPRAPAPQPKERAAYWISKGAMMDRAEVKVRRSLFKQFFMMRSETLARIRKEWKRLVVNRPTGKQFGPPPNLVNHFVFDLEEAARNGAATILPIIEEAVEVAAADATLELGLLSAVGADFEVSEAVSASLAQIPTRVKGFTGSVHANLSKTIGEGIASGLSEKSMAKAVKTQFRLSAFQHAPTIARTETATAFNHARFQVFTEAGIKQHQWVTARDGIVRETHIIQDGEIVAMGEQFANGLIHPNDLGGEPSEVINCRCVALPLLPGEEAAA